MDDDDKVVSLDRLRTLRDFEGEDKLLYVEILWGESGAFAVNAAVRDMEAMRRGTEDPSKPLRDPETVFEAESILRRLRYVANCLAREWGLDEQVRPADWMHDEPEAESG